MAQGGGIATGPLCPAGHFVMKWFSNGVVYCRFEGACEQYRIRGFKLVGAKPDLSAEVYTGPWGKADDIQREFEMLMGGAGQ